MYIEVIKYKVDCDWCSNDDLYDECDSEQEADRLASKQGWLVKDGHHLCPECIKEGETI